jgi:hypothetical protein
LNKIRHKISGLIPGVGAVVYYSQLGIEIKPLLLKKSILIPWQDIAFINSTLIFLDNEREGVPYEGMDEVNETELKNVDFLNFDIVLKDRHKLTIRMGFIEKLWTRINLPIVKPLAGSDDKQEPLQGSFEYKISRNTLNSSINKLLKLVNTYGKNGLIVHF